jgi:antitoxin Phd
MARLARSKWKLADAKNRFSELVNRALAEGPQLVERRADSVVVLDLRVYEKLTG